MSKYQPPKCPGCGNPLNTVFENDYLTYIFNPNTGGYKSDELAGEIDIKCPACGINLNDVFEEGACNYQAKKGGD